MIKEFNVGDTVYTIDNNDKPVELIITRKSIILVNSNKNSVEYTAESEDKEIKISFLEDEDLKLSKIFLTVEDAKDFINGADPKLMLYKLISTDGSSDRLIDYVLIQARFLRRLGNDTTSARLTDPGMNWFKKTYSYPFDNGGYYRMYPVSEKNIHEIKEKINKLIRILDLWEKTK